ncbi:MAG: hypothetical protein ACTFAL_07730 [Candidatus Electronema sp. V4]|uniref:hypothetical protein n=1 Tax=Candidatus Electronema sp. JC TaxID=3401570 RepID=UPI003AA92E5A
MSSLMWLLFLAMLALLAVSLLWFIWKLRSFSQSQNQTVDDKLLQAMMSDAALSGKVKEALVKKSKEKVAEPEA